MTGMTSTLVLLPGLDGTGMLFEPLLRELSPEISAQVVPLPNRLPMGYKDLVPVITASLPRDGAYFLLGESFSGPLALMIAAGRPAGLQGVILCASFIRNPTYVPSFLRFIAGAWSFRLLPLVMKTRRSLSKQATFDLRVLLARVHSEMLPAVIARRIRSILSLDCSEFLKECPVPMAYLRGAQDKVVPAKNCRGILAINPSVREIVIQDAPHLLLQTQPRAAAKAIEAFMHDVNSQPGA
jgi:pimeloyl-ACP methyl ester carboxylesterase